MDVRTYHKLLRRPPEALAFNLTGTSVLLASGPGLLVGVNWVNTSGVLIVVDVFDGLDSRGLLMYSVARLAVGSGHTAPTPYPPLFERGLWLVATGAQVIGTALVKLLRSPGQSAD